MTTLFDMTYALAQKVTGMWHSTATATANNSLTDAAANFSDDVVNGTIFVRSGSLAGKTIVVTGKTSTTVLTFATQAANLASGDSYSLCNKDYPREQLRDALNQAWRELAPNIDDDSTLTTVSGQEEYTLPAGVSNIVRVQVATQVAAPYGYETLYHWDEKNGKLIFPARYAPDDDGYILLLTYRAPWVDLNDDADVVPSDVDNELVLWQAATYIYRDAARRYDRDNKRGIVDGMNEAQQELVRRKGSHNLPRRTSRPSNY